MNTHKSNDFLAKGVLKKEGFKRRGMRIFFFFLVLVFLCVQEGMAQENALLTGFVKSIDQKNGIVWINVTSQPKSCKGLREFRMPEDAKEDLNTSLIGKRLQFLINTGKCERGKVYEILLER